jgi:hypothetical protein
MISLIGQMLWFVESRRQSTDAREDVAPPFRLAVLGHFERMRFGYTVLFMLVAGGAAQASSFAVLPARTDVASPSILVLGAPQSSFATASIESVPAASSPSIIALGEPAVTYENVAAIPPEPEATAFNAAQLPMVIRGGITGEAFPDAAPVAAVPEPVESSPGAEPEDPPPPPPAGSDTAGKPEEVVDPEAAANLITTE